MHFPHAAAHSRAFPCSHAGLAVKVRSHSWRCACTSVCDSWPALKRSSSVRRGIRNVCDVASAGEKANRKKERCGGGDKGKRVCFYMTAAGIRRGGEGRGLTPETACKHRNKGRWVARGSYQSRGGTPKGNGSNLETDGGVFPTSESLQKRLC